MRLIDIIKENNNTSLKDKAKSIIFLRRHLDEGLKYEYLTVKDSSVLWKDLKDRYDHQRDVILPVVTDEWYIESVIKISECCRTPIKCGYSI